jgi:hypothetical protein
MYNEAYTILINTSIVGTVVAVVVLWLNVEWNFTMSTMNIQYEYLVPHYTYMCAGTSTTVSFWICVHTQYSRSKQKIQYSTRTKYLYGFAVCVKLCSYDTHTLFYVHTVRVRARMSSMMKNVRMQPYMMNVKGVECLLEVKISGSDLWVICQSERRVRDEEKDEY